MTDPLNTKNTSAEHGGCTCTGVGLRTKLARLTGRVKHAPNCIGLLAIQSDTMQSHDCRESVGFSHERGNFCKVCDRFILNAELG